ncbi:MAG TPA: acyl carrier protein [Prosthecobacter sp.]|nr:acyl carrier protein [Prosthecobacter sp.]
MPPAEISAAHVIDLLIDQQIVDPSEPLTAESDLFACGMDSLAMMQLLLHLERVFAVRVQPEEMTRERFATAGKLAEWLTGRKSIPV